MHGTTLTSVGNVHHLLQPNENEDFTMLKGGWGLRPCYIASGITSNVYSNLYTLGWQSVLFQVEIIKLMEMLFFLQIQWPFLGRGKSNPERCCYCSHNFSLKED